MTREKQGKQQTLAKNEKCRGRMRKKKGMQEEEEDKTRFLILWFMYSAEQSPMGWVLPVCGQEREQKGSAGARGSSDC